MLTVKPAVRLHANQPSGFVPTKTAKHQIGLRVRCSSSKHPTTNGRIERVQLSNKERSRYLVKCDTPQSGQEARDLVHSLGVFLGTVAIGWGAGISVATAAGFGFNDKELGDPVEPFTVYGSVFKKLVIDVLDEGGTKILSRKRGVTTVSCVSLLAASRESPEFQGLPTGLKVTAFGEEICRRAEAEEVPQACGPSCKAACTDSAAKYRQTQKSLLGYTFSDKDEARVIKSCSRNCNLECTKPGKTSSWVVPFRNLGK